MQMGRSHTYGQNPSSALQKVTNLVSDLCFDSFDSSFDSVLTVSFDSFDSWIDRQGQCGGLSAVHWAGSHGEASAGLGTAPVPC